MPDHHWSDCALHSLPARFPGPCDCGKVKAGIESARASGRPGEILVVRLKSFVELWKARSTFVRENLGTPRHYLQTIAKRIGLGPRRRRSREYGAPPS